MHPQLFLGITTRLGVPHFVCAMFASQSASRFSFFPIVFLCVHACTHTVPIMELAGHGVPSRGKGASSISRDGDTDSGDEMQREIFFSTEARGDKREEGKGRVRVVLCYSLLEAKFPMDR